MAIVNDSHLAYLLSLGFDIDLCKQALAQNCTLENATEWILNPSQPPEFTNVVGPNIQFVPSTPPPHSITEPFSSPIIQKDDEELKYQKKQFEKIANELKKDRQMEKEARQRALKEIKEDQENRKLKQIKTSTSTAAVQQDLTESEHDQLKYRKEKRAEQEQRQRVLENIKKDKKMRKLSPPPASSSSVSASTYNNKPIHEDQSAFIQFKLTNASILRQKFPATTTVKGLLEFVYIKEVVVNNSITINDVSLMCPFPRRTFTMNDQTLDMKDAGFLPNVSLNVIVALPPPVPAVIENQVEDQEQEVEEDQMDQDDHQEEADEEAEMEEESESDDSDEYGDMDIDYRPPVNSRRINNRHINNRPIRIWDRPNAQAGHHLTDPSPPVTNASTNNVDTAMHENNNDQGEGEREENRRIHMLSAIEQRSQNNQNTTTAAATNNTRKQRHTKTLKDLTTVSVAILLNQHTISTTRYLKKLNYVSSELAESLVAYLIKSGKLNVSTLKKLADHCYLQNLVLDSYSYCTDSLIEALCISNSSISITKLSLRGCDVITDGAIHFLEKLKNLTYLDLNNCKVIDKGLKSLEKLQYLLYLNLSKTKITNAGLSSMVRNAKFKNELQVLLLDGCTRISSTGILIPIINEFVNLIQLSFAYTTPGKEIEIQAQQQVITNKQIRLEQLDVNHTFITDQDLIGTISQFKNLVELKLGGCGQLTTRSLSFLPRELKNLRLIQFPNREHELDGVLSRYKGLPIEHLDLTGYLNVTDEGAQYIASMRNLRYLSLDGTKITDEGVMLFENLIELEKLYLDRTLLTDAGIEKLTGLSKLETLSLCRTKVSNIGLCLMGDFEQTSFARTLRTLNLSQCNLVSDKGVRGLAGMINLCNLNLDHTSVSKSCVKYLKDLQNLNLVRLQGIHKEEDEAIDFD